MRKNRYHTLRCSANSISIEKPKIASKEYFSIDEKVLRTDIPRDMKFVTATRSRQCNDIGNSNRIESSPDRLVFNEIN